MRFTLSSTALSSRLNTLARVINSKNALPILDCFLFQVENGRLLITAGDGENVGNPVAHQKIRNVVGYFDSHKKPPFLQRPKG